MTNIEHRSELKPNHRWFQIEMGPKIGAHEHSCLFCKHLTDFFWDYTNGPYMFFCDVEAGNDNVSASFDGKCPMYEEED